jgi:hypothetical protein
VLDLRGRPDTATRLSEAGRQFARAHLRDRQVERLEELLLGMVGNGFRAR